MVTIVDPRSRKRSNCQRSGPFPEPPRSFTMRSFGVRLPILAATAWAGIGFSVSGMDLGYTETVYVTPTVATVAWPTVLCRVPAVCGFDRVQLSQLYPGRLRTGHAGADLRDDRLPGQEGAFRPAPAGRETALASYLPTTYVSSGYYPTSYRLGSYTPTVYRPTVFEYPRVWESSYRVASGSDCDRFPATRR